MLSRSRKLSMAIDLDSESQSVIPNLPVKEKKKLRRKLKFYHFLIQRRILFPLLSGAFFQLDSAALEPVMSPRLKELGVSQIGIGGFFSLCPLFFIIGAIVC